MSGDEPSGRNQNGIADEEDPLGKFGSIGRQNAHGCITRWRRVVFLWPEAILLKAKGGNSRKIGASARRVMSINS
jgi:hypothetical protein